jgi:alpha-tubulin suppressor-like RCC1 family protein
VGLGDGLATHSTCNTSAGAIGCAPTPVMATGISGVVDLAVGQAHACVLLGTGEVRCWGSNANGQLGRTGVTRSALPLGVTAIDP